MRDILRRRTLDQAVAAALHPRRASSYNNLLSHRDGGVVSVEGSATDAELLRPDADGTLAHTNHYTSARMARVRARSGRRRPARGAGTSASAWLAAGPDHARPPARALSDHTGAPDSLCRHIEDGASSKTVFWCIADVTEGTVRYGRGNPCDSREQRYAFA